MQKLTLQRILALGLVCWTLIACQRGEPPLPKVQASEPVAQPVATDLLKPQREALNKAKALEGQMDQQTIERQKAVEAAQK